MRPRGSNAAYCPGQAEIAGPSMGNIMNFELILSKLHSMMSDGTRYVNKRRGGRETGRLVRELTHQEEGLDERCLCIITQWSEWLTSVQIFKI